MKQKFKTLLLSLIALTAITVSSCKKDNEEPEIIKEGIERSELWITEVTAPAPIDAHGDHFHGLSNLVDGEKTIVKFDADGNATANGHLHLEADAVYRMELKSWDYTGKEVQQTFIANKATADNFKAFLVGGNLVLNADSQDESGAIFQPREATYTDGTVVTGQYETTGLLSYLIFGHDNEGPTKKVTYVLRKLNKDVKASITRSDWNRDDYATKFAGEDVLKLKFEIHIEEGHGH